MKKTAMTIILCVSLILLATGCDQGSIAPIPESKELVPLSFRTNTPGQLVQNLHYMGPPLEDVGLSRWNRRLPNAARTYRNGVHEGMDYFVRRNTPVLAAGDGDVVRADHNFVEMTLEDYNEAISIAKDAETTPEDIADKLLGRQVWIAHADGVVTRYAHLECVEESIQVGTSVIRGQEIGNVGNSGTKYSIVGSSRFFDGAPHLHFEVWNDGTFLGEDRPFSEVRTIYKRIFHKD